MKIRITPHAEEQIRLRKLDGEYVIQTAASPEQIAPAGHDRFFAQSRQNRGGKEYVLRVLVEDIGDERWVITVYPTSKARKYWQEK